MNLSQIVLNSLCVPHFGLLTLHRPRVHIIIPHSPRWLTQNLHIFMAQLRRKATVSVSGNGCRAPHVGLSCDGRLSITSISAEGFSSLLNEFLIFSDPCSTRLILAQCIYFHQASLAMSRLTGCPLVETLFFSFIYGVTTILFIVY